MSFNNTPTSSRLHIGVFGRTNAGKSTLVNKITEQKASLVSHIKGTTTDPVYKQMELLPLGPVVIIDTAGFDDETQLGDLRKEKTYEVLRKTHIALLVISEGISDYDREFIKEVNSRKIPIIIIFNKTDIYMPTPDDIKEVGNIPYYILTENNINPLKEFIISNIPEEKEKGILDCLVEKNDIVVLVMPIDSAAPKGRLILPQQQTLREILDIGAIGICCQDSELEDTLNALNKKPKIVITDSQAFKKVAEIVPEDIPLTSFSILFARYKGELEPFIKGNKIIEELKESDKVLIAEGCTHHKQKDDIGTVKIPNLLRKKAGKNIKIDYCHGIDFPDNLTDYKLIIHCGGCMLNNKEMMHRISVAEQNGVYITNYGLFLAHMNNILPRAIKPLEK